MCCHIIHIAVPAPREPGAQPLLSSAELAVGDADLLEAQLLAPALDVAGEHGEIRHRNFLHSPNLKPQITRFLPAESDTVELGAALGRALHPGTIVYLLGELGAGKTTFARGVLRGLGYGGRVKSPSFTLVEPYSFSRLNLYHFDFYRFNDPHELADSGLREHFNEAAVCLIEWPEKASGLPRADIRIQIGVTSGGRTVDLHAETENGRLCLQRLQDMNAG